jgi:hypothetical protein
VLAGVLALALGALALGGPPPAAAQEGGWVPAPQPRPPVPREPAAPVKEPGPAWVQLCEHQNYQGRCETFTADNRNLIGSFLGGDKASSVRIAPGTLAALYEHNSFNGQCTTVTRDIPDLNGTRVGNDRVSSVRVGIGCVNPRPTSGGVQLCEHPNYGGACQTFTSSQGFINDLRDYGFEDRVSSVRLAPDVATVAIFEHPGFRGPCQEFSANHPDLNVGSILRNDSASSLKIGRGCEEPQPTTGVTFCTAIHFRGDCRHYWYSPSQVGYGYDNAFRSVRLAPGVIVSVYEHTDFKGRCETIVADDESLHDNVIREDLSSFEIGKTCRPA